MKRFAFKPLKYVLLHLLQKLFVFRFLQTIKHFSNNSIENTNTGYKQYHLTIARFDFLTNDCFKIIPIFLTYSIFMNIEKIREELFNIEVLSNTTFYYCVKNRFSFNFACFCEFF